MRLRSFSLVAVESILQMNVVFCWLVPEHLMVFPSSNSSPAGPDALEVELCKANMQLLPLVTRKQQRFQDKAIASAMKISAGAVTVGCCSGHICKLCMHLQLCQLDATWLLTLFLQLFLATTCEAS